LVSGPSSGELIKLTRPTVVPSGARGQGTMPRSLQHGTTSNQHTGHASNRGARVAVAAHRIACGHNRHTAAIHDCTDGVRHKL
jgi:hypothetical protein